MLWKTVLDVECVCVCETDVDHLQAFAHLLPFTPFTSRALLLNEKSEQRGNARGWAF